MASSATVSRLNMMSSSSSINLGLILLLAIMLFAGMNQARCQEVNSRAAADKPESDSALGGGSSRSVYSQKHLSPHRMMHFGKRPLLPPPPMFSVLQPLPPTQQQQQAVANVLDLFQPVGEQRARLQAATDDQAASAFPYSLYFEMPRMAPVGAVQSSQQQPFAHVSAAGNRATASELSSQEARNNHIQDVVEYLLKMAAAQEEACKNESRQRQQVQESPPRLMKLLSPEGSEAQEQLLQQQQQQQQQGELMQSVGQASAGDEAEDAINVVGRSVPPQGGMHLTKAHIASLLYGRRVMDPPSSLMSLGNFMKKAEPTKMTFMHFGRR